MAEKPTRSFRLTEEAQTLLSKLAERDGINDTAELEVLIREKARERGILPQKPEGR